MTFGFLPRRSLANPLIQRVRRHAGFSALFRSAASSAPRVVPDFGAYSPLFEAAVRPLGTHPQTPVVSASLKPVLEEQAGALPSGPPPGAVTLMAEVQSRPAPVAGISPQIAPTVATPPQTSAGAGEIAPPPVRRQVAPLVEASPAVQVPSQPASLPEPAPEPKSAEEEDRIWRRLQNIFRKHEEKRLAEEQSRSGAAEKETSLGSATEMPPTQAAPSAGAPGLQSDQVTSSPVQRLDKPVLQEKPASVSSPQPETLVSPRTARPRPPSIVEVEASDRDLSGAGVKPPTSEARLKPQLPSLETPPSPTSSTASSAETVSMEAEGAAAETLISPEVKTSLSEPAALEASAASEQAEAPPAHPPSEISRIAPGKSPLEAQPPTPSGSKTASTALQRQLDQSPEQPSPSPQVGAPPTKEGARIAPPSARSLPPEAVLSSLSPATPPEEVPEALQAVPLEEAWSVERLDVPPVEKSLSEDRLPPPSASLATSPEARQVSSLLQEVAPGQPTDSLVEIVTPRRPRPAAPPPKSTMLMESPSEIESPREEDEAGVAQEAFSTVPTEIGPLPADLWRLIGQEPPAEAQSAAPAPAQPLKAVQRKTQSEAPATRPTSPGEPAQSEPEDAQWVAAYPAGPFSSEAALDVLQRAPEEAQPPPSSPPEAPPAETLPGAEVNVDELTRKVYQEIKRRLASEWERMRRRF